MDYIRPALKYDNQLALMSSTKALVEVILSVDVSTYSNCDRFEIISTTNYGNFHAVDHAAG
jgi:hypothetical protein